MIKYLIRIYASVSIYQFLFQVYKMNSKLSRLTYLAQYVGTDILVLSHLNFFLYDDDRK